MDVEVRERTLPLSDPLATAEGRIEDRTVFLVRLDRDGETGIGEAAPLPGWTESVETCREALSAAIDCLPGDPRGATSALEDAPAARHGVRLAAVERAARVAGDPLYRHLGAPRERREVPVNATVGDGSVAETVAAAERAVERGFDTLKVKVGAREVGGDVERIRGVREAVGDEVVVRADANGAWSREEARRAFGAFRDLRVSYVEQPLPAGDLAGLRSLRGDGVGVAVDETLREHSVEAVVAADAADAVVLKPMVAGDPEAVAERARYAVANGVDPVVTTTIDAAVARTAAVHCAATIPSPYACGLATADRLAEDVGPDPAPVEGGAMRVPQSPGLADDGTRERWWSG
jgi:o-succinylbenzoate synthase